MNHNTRIEHDSMGSIEVPESALYGAQTQRALNNFTISHDKMPEQLIRALLLIKRGAADANKSLGLLSEQQYRAIRKAIETLHQSSLMDHFPVPVLQTGSGTSTNMNMNEVIARLAEQEGTTISPNDHVNMGQSSNDVIPSATHIASAIQLKSVVVPALSDLIQVIEETASKHGDVIKTGRTHLMDALPIKLEHEMNAWAAQLRDTKNRLRDVSLRLSRLPLGGTAVGSGVNCAPGFAERALKTISLISGITFEQMDSAFMGLSSIDTVLETSGHLKTGAISLMKIANDLRWMNSGPHAGLAEIGLAPLQPGSSIMVDKVNPVIPEAVLMACARIIGNDASITVAAQSGNFQLNTMMPLAASDVINSGELFAGAARLLGEKAIAGFRVLRENVDLPLRQNPVLVTALTPHIGYMKAAELAKKAREERRPVMEVALESTDLDPELLKRLLDPEYLANGGRDRE